METTNLIHLSPDYLPLVRHVNGFILSPKPLYPDTIDLSFYPLDHTHDFYWIWCCEVYPGLFFYFPNSVQATLFAKSYKCYFSRSHFESILAQNPQWDYSYVRLHLKSSDLWK